MNCLVARSVSFLIRISFSFLALAKNRATCAAREARGRPFDGRVVFALESGGGKESIPGRPVVWRRLRGYGPLGIVAQAGEPVADDYVLLSGNPDALEQLRLCNVLDLRRVQATAPAQRVIALSPATSAMVARLREHPTGS